MRVKTKKTLPNCDLVKPRGFADETTAESSHGADVDLLESTYEESAECTHGKHSRSMQFCWIILDAELFL